MNEKLIVRMKELCKMTGLSRSSIYSKLNPKSPFYQDSFPQKILLSQRAVGFLYDDIVAWVDAQKTTSNH